MGLDPLDFEVKKTIGEITKAVFSVVQEIGHQFDDTYNDACLRTELALRDIPFIRINLPMFYKGHRLEGIDYKNYLLVKDFVLVEVASTFDVKNTDVQKLKSGLVHCGKDTGIVINFLNGNKNDMIQLVTREN